MTGRPRRSQNRRDSRKTRNVEEDTDEPGDDDPVSDLRDIMLHMLECMCCEHCLGTGRMIDGQKEDGTPRFAFCVCRQKAGAFVEEFR